jgi:hypothetical protein
MKYLANRVAELHFLVAGDLLSGEVRPLPEDRPIPPSMSLHVYQYSGCIFCLL